LHTSHPAKVSAQILLTTVAIVQADSHAICSHGDDWTPIYAACPLTFKIYEPQKLKAD
jgi:hypothetical protein